VFDAGVDFVAVLGSVVSRPLAATRARLRDDITVISSGANSIRPKATEWARCLAESSHHRLSNANAGYSFLGVRDGTGGVCELHHALPLPPCNNERSPRTPRKVSRMVEGPLMLRPRSPDSNEACDAAPLPLFVCSLLLLAI